MQRSSLMGKAYGFFEIPSVTAAVVAIDIMCKTADVQLVTWEKKLGGRHIPCAFENLLKIPYLSGRQT